MNKIIVSVFDSEESAFEGLSAMRELHSEGSISLYASAVLAKDESGEVHIRQAADIGPYGTATGMAVGGLVGLLAGPAGMAAGAAANAVAAATMGGAVLGASFGGLTGMLFDLDDAGVDADFVEEVSAALSPGKVAVVAEVEEYWMTPVDTKIEEAGGIVFRRLRSEIAEEQYQREARAFKEEWNQLKAEWKEASDDAKAAIEKKMDTTKAKIQAIQDRTKEKMDQYKAEADAKIAVLNQQREEVREERKAKIDAKIEEVKADYHRRNEKLKEAWGLTKEALGPDHEKAA